MQVVNPYYARESSVGPVFDVGTFVGPKWYSPKWLVALSLGIGCLAVASVLLFPGLLEWVQFDATRRAAESLQRSIETWQKDYPWPLLGGAALACGLAYIFLAVLLASQLLRTHGPVYLRVGPGGMSLRIPAGLDKFRPWYKFLELDAPWQEIAGYKIVQHKQMGSLSPNAGNLNAFLHLRLNNGAQHIIDLDWFREPARVIYGKIQDSVEMVPMDFPQENAADEHAPVSTQDRPFRDRQLRVSAFNDQRRHIEESLGRVLTNSEAFVIFSDPATEKFVQFCTVGGSLQLDLPAQALTHDEQQRADEYFRRLSPASDASRSGQSAVGVQTGFELGLGTDVTTAARIVLEIFDHVYLASPGYDLVIDEQAG